MASTLADLSPERRSELATYLARFSPGNPGDEHEPLQYWELVAERLRSDYPNKFSGYTEARLAAMNERILLEDLSRRAFPLAKFKTVLEVINCQPGLNVFQDAIPPIIRRQPPNNIDVKEGSPIVLKVEAECRPGQPEYQWFKERDPIVGQVKHTLLIKNAAIANSGKYICRVTNAYINDPQKATVFSRYMTVTVVRKKEVPSSNPRIWQEVGGETDSQQVSTPKILRHPSPITATLNSRAELMCEAEGAAVYDWFKNGTLLRSTGTSGRFVIEKTAVSDAGVYHCVAISTKGGKAESQTAKLTVEKSIMVTKQPEDVEVRVDGKFTLTCKASNQYNKKLTYKWFQREANGREELVKEGEEFVGHTSMKRNAELKFFCRVSVEDNPDLCATSNTAKVKVKTLWITEEPERIKDVIGNRGLLHCQAKGLGKITYRWFKSDTKEGKPEPIYHSENEWYIIKRLAQKHWGYYFCQAENQFENARSRTVHVSAHLPTAGTISRRTRVLQSPALIKIVKQPWSQVIPLGGRFRLLCEAVSSGDEPLFYQWYFRGDPIPDATEQTYIRENIDSSAYGSYWCFVCSSSNTKPDVSKSARIEQSITPSPALSSRSGNFERIEAEMELMTMSKERFAREKVALLIGNQRYDAEELNNLKSPEGDIEKLHRDLEGLDFKVISLVNLRHSEIMKALEEFYKMLAVPGIYALFYYSGHGFQTPEKRSYLIPVDAGLPLHLEYNIYVDGIIRQMQQKLSRAFVILDCCRSVVQNHIPDERLHSLNSLDSLSLGPVNMSNYVEISSCVDNFTADDTHGEAAGLTSPTTGLPTCRSRNSFFNVALREALKDKTRNMFKVHHAILRKFIEANLEQRPQYKGSFADEKITLHDAVMIDDPQRQEDLLNKVLATYEQARAVPAAILLEGEEKLGKLAGLARLEVVFWNKFSNVLHIMTKLVLLQKDKTTTVNVEYDPEFIRCQFVSNTDVTIKQGTCFMDSASCQAEEEVEEEEGGQEEYESLFVTTLTVFNIQRLKSKQNPKLKLFLTATVGTEGTDKEANISYEVPLTTHLLNKKE